MTLPELIIRTHLTAEMDAALAARRAKRLLEFPKRSAAARKGKAPRKVNG